MKKQLFEITVVVFKTFYVEAESQEKALEHPAVEDEQSPNWSGDFDWEHHETDAKPIGPDQSKFIRKVHPEMIVKEDND